MWRAAFDGVRRVVYWPFALPDERVAEASHWLRDSLARQGIQAEVDAWPTLAGRTYAELETADLLFVGGGTTSKLLGHICRFGFRDKVLEFIANGGRYYGGSAGAVIACDSIMIASLAGRDAAAATSPAAFGLVTDVTVLPHANTFARSDLHAWAHKLDQPILAIPEAGGLHVRDDIWESIGPEGSLLVSDQGALFFEPGSRILV